MSCCHSVEYIFILLFVNPSFGSSFSVSFLYLSSVFLVTSPKRLHFTFADSLKAHLTKMSSVPLIVKDQNSGLSTPKSSVICSDLSLILQLIRWVPQHPMKLQLVHKNFSFVLSDGNFFFHCLQAEALPNKQWLLTWSCLINWIYSWLRPLCQDCTVRFSVPLCRLGEVVEGTSPVTLWLIK